MSQTRAPAQSIPRASSLSPGAVLSAFVGVHSCLCALCSPVSLSCWQRSRTSFCRNCSTASSVGFLRVAHASGKIMWQTPVDEPFVYTRAYAPKFEQHSGMQGIECSSTARCLAGSGTAPLGSAGNFVRTDPIDSGSCKRSAILSHTLAGDVVSHRRFAARVWHNHPTRSAVYRFDSTAPCCVAASTLSCSLSRLRARTASRSLWSFKAHARTLRTLPIRTVTDAFRLKQAARRRLSSVGRSLSHAMWHVVCCMPRRREATADD
jgi:hypothetical protein